jgi:site-specific recombinase XerD
MGFSVVADSVGHRIVGPGGDVDVVNGFLEHLSVRNFSPATRRAYAFDLLNFLRFLSGRALRVGAVVPTDLFDYLDWQRQPRGSAQPSVVVELSSRTGAAPATMNRRIAAVRGLFEYAVVAGVCSQNPVPAARRSTGVRARRRGLLGHLGPGRSGRGAGRLVRAPKRLPGALEAREVAEFVADLSTARDRAMALLMLLGGLRAMEVRGLLLADVDLGLRRVRMLGKGGKERTVPVDAEFFTELAIYLRSERPPGCGTRECFVVLRGPTRGQAMTEAGMRRIFRTHRVRAGTPRVCPHRLRHTYGTQLASAGMDLLVLRELMGHASPETTAGSVHLSVPMLAAEYAAARTRMAAL